jgi:Leucine-rich repeat (LRR) protein
MNQFSGAIPAQLGSLTGLSFLYLDENALVGDIPAGLGSLVNLVTLWLHHNQLTGNVPESLENLTSLCTPGLTGCWEYGLDLGYNYLNTPAAPQSLADFLQVKDPDWAVTQWRPFTSCEDVPDVPAPECQVLVNFYNATGGTGWYGDENWLEVGVVSWWEGVAINDGRVDRLNLDGMGLKGNIPTDLGTLVEIEELSLRGNELSGPINAALGELEELEWLDLSCNQLTGEIPAELGRLDDLDGLLLDDNQLTGEIPQQLASLDDLDYLDLSSNRLTGTLPDWLGLMTGLSDLDLGDNQFSGNIPTELWELHDLDSLYLGGNQLTGGIPEEIGSMEWLHEVDLSRNRLSGSIPVELGKLESLRILNLSSNQLSGDIPQTLTGLSGLCDLQRPYCDDYGLDLGYNRLSTSPLPQELESFLAEKDPTWRFTQAVNHTLPGQDSQVVSRDGLVDLFIPSGSVPTGSKITFAPLAYPGQKFNDHLVFASTAFLLEIDGSTAAPTVFAPPARLTIRYTDAGVEDLREGSLHLYRWDASRLGWADAAYTCPTPSTYTRSPEDNSISLQICKPGEYALFQAIDYLIYLTFIHH